MTWVKIWDTTGPRGTQGIEGKPGSPGVNAVPAATAVAAYLAEIGNAARLALEAKLRADSAQVGFDHPRLRKPLNAPILKRSDTSAVSITWPYMVDMSKGAETSFALYYSTDHASHSDSGLFRATAPSPLQTFTDAGRVYRDDVAGSQTETPTVFWDDITGYWVALYQQFGVGTGVQSTLWARSTNGIAWTRMGVAFDYVAGDAGNGHTGYAKRFKLAGSEYAYSLYGGGDAGKQALWKRDDGNGTMNWTVDPRQITSQVHLLGDFGTAIVGEPTADPLTTPASVANIVWKSFQGDVIMWKGRPWWIGGVGPHGAGGASTPDRIAAAPLRDDLLGFAEKPIDITPPSQSWEGDGLAFGNIFPFNGKLYATYRAGGTSGGFGIMEVY